MTPVRNGDALSIKLKQSTLKMMPENIQSKEESTTLASGDPNQLVAELLKENEILKS